MEFHFTGSLFMYELNHAGEQIMIFSRFLSMEALILNSVSRINRLDQFLIILTMSDSFLSNFDPVPTN